MFHHTVRAFCIALGFGSAVQAEAPRVATDIAPVHALASIVMKGVGEPALIVPANSSPHGYSMRPSEASALAEADMVIWVGENLTPWLEKSLDTLAPKAIHLELMDLPGTKLLSFRTGVHFAEHDHKAQDEHHEDDDHDEHDHDEHSHDDHEDHADGDDHAGHEDHDGHHDGDHGTDPHVWLNPDNAVVWLPLIAEKLAKIDPEHADTYAQNAKDGIADIQAAAQDIAQELLPLQDRPYLVFHDGYQYFEMRFGLSAVGSISLGDASDPSPKRISDARGLVQETQAKCVFSEVQYNSGLVDVVIEGSDAKTAVLDPIGAFQEPGADLYVNLLRKLADQFIDCL